MRSSQASPGKWTRSRGMSDRRGRIACPIAPASGFQERCAEMSMNGRANVRPLGREGGLPSDRFHAPNPKERMSLMGRQRALATRRVDDHPASGLAVPA